MSTTEDFKKAPIGAMATHEDGARALKVDGPERRWILQNGLYLDDKEIEQWGYTLDPLDSAAPTTAQEALALAWELADPIKEGQEIPKGTRVLRRVLGSIREYRAGWDFDAATPFDHLLVRTLDPLPEPEPDWLDAPAVIAVCNDSMDRAVFVRENEAGTRWVRDTRFYRWDELIDVVPLYPKEDA